MEQTREEEANAFRQAFNRFPGGRHSIERIRRGVWIIKDRRGRPVEVSTTERGATTIKNYLQSYA